MAKEKMGKGMHEKDDNIPDIVDSAKKQPPGAGMKQGKMGGQVESDVGDDAGSEKMPHEKFADAMSKKLGCC